MKHLSLKNKWDQNKSVVNGWCSIPSTVTAEIMSLNNSTKEKQLQLMQKVNPNIIPRNHKVEEALLAADNNNFDVMNKLLSVLKNPYDIKDISEFQSPAPLSKEKYQTFCGT